MSTANTEEHHGHGFGVDEHGKFHHAHHFNNAHHQYESSKQGIWLFMVTEILMFGGLFVAYAIYKSLYAPIFHVGGSYLDVKWGSINTVVLITSSFTMALGIYFNQVNKQSKAVIALAITILCAFGFMGIKYIEYSHKIHDGLLPGKYFHNEKFAQDVVNYTLSLPEEELSPSMFELAQQPEKLKKFAPLYFGFYFCMTGLHGIHVLVGAGLIFWIMIKTSRKKFNSEYYTPVEGVGIFWHIVDLIWIYLFPLLYLVG
ncbi:MAG: cytochrome c oxidase subunit 3 family protein [Leptospiraceae bacterium]|nr:cytochrome c oxidase subunit 3 family protein [Leptospiraceae bacterium]